MITHLPLCQQQDDRLAGALANGVELSVQDAFPAADATGNIPFFEFLSRLAAVQRAFRWWR
jgi:hypothetical protein